MYVPTTDEQAPKEHVDPYIDAIVTWDILVCRQKNAQILWISIYEPNVELCAANTRRTLSILLIPKDSECTGKLFELSTEHSIYIVLYFFDVYKSLFFFRILYTKIHIFH